jgi:hypothetical protein
MKLFFRVFARALIKKSRVVVGILFFNAADKIIDLSHQMAKPFV